MQPKSKSLFFNDKLVCIFEKAVSRDEAINKLASLLEAGGYVKTSFHQAVVDREKVFPTGLPTRPVGIAIPHTDAEHVKSGAIAVGILKEPVIFSEMGNPDSSVEVFIITMLAISEPDMLIPFLSKLAKTFQNTDFLLGLKSATTIEEVLQLYRQVLPDVIESGE